jgi:hypothetical protein
MEKIRGEIMPTVAHVVAHMVNQQPFLKEAMLQDIVSYARLAHWMKPNVERELGKQVREGAIVMALHRIADRSSEEEKSSRLVFAQGDIMLSIKSDLVEISFLRSRSAMDSVASFYGKVNFAQGEVFNATQGNYEISVVLSRRLEPEFRKHMRKESVCATETALAFLSVKFPPSVVSTPGFFAQVTNQLAWNSINVVELLSTYTELTLVLEENSVTKAYNLLQDMFRRELPERRQEESS